MSPFAYTFANDANGGQQEVKDQHKKLQTGTRAEAPYCIPAFLFTPFDVVSNLKALGVIIPRVLVCRSQVVCCAGRCAGDRVQEQLELLHKHCPLWSRHKYHCGRRAGANSLLRVEGRAGGMRGPPSGGHACKQANVVPIALLFGDSVPAVCLNTPCCSTEQSG